MRISDWSSDVCSSDLVEFARDALAVFVVDVAGLGEAELARGPVQQLRAQARFEFLHLAADGGLGQAQGPGGGDETALLDHLDEDEGVVEISGHGGAPNWCLGIGPSEEIGRASGRERVCQYV